MRKKTIWLIIAAILVIAGVVLQFVSSYIEKTAARYRPVIAIVDSIELHRTNTLAMPYTLMQFSYTIDGQEYHRNIREPYFIFDVTEGQEWRAYYLEDKPAEAISLPRRWNIARKAPVPGYIGWGLIGIAALMFLWHGTDMIPAASKSGKELGLKFRFGKRKYTSKEEASHAEPLRVELPEDKSQVVQEIEMNSRGTSFLRL